MGVRWDAVVQDNDFWSDAVLPARDVAGAAEHRPVPVQVWLFGSLADGIAERPLTVQCRGAFSVGDVIAELGRRCGQTFLDRVTDSGGDVFRTCRIYVNGQPVDDVKAPVCTDALQADIELILLTAAEGG